MARRPPELIVRLRLGEDEGQVFLDADSAEAEHELRAWLLRSRAVGALPRLVRGCLLAELNRDREDDERVA
jgi:hypothetical protein